MPKTKAKPRRSTASKKELPKSVPKPNLKHKRGLINLPISKIVEFVGGSQDTVVAVSRKSLVEAQLANAEVESQAALDSLDNEDL